MTSPGCHLSHKMTCQRFLFSRGRVWAASRKPKGIRANSNNPKGRFDGCLESGGWRGPGRFSVDGCGTVVNVGCRIAAWLRDGFLRTIVTSTTPSPWEPYGEGTSNCARARESYPERGFVLAYFSCRLCGGEGARNRVPR